MIPQRSRLGRWLTRLQDRLLVYASDRPRARGWEVWEVESGEVHVRPARDLTPHEPTQECVCGPTVDFTGERPLVTHHSLDGREAHE